MERQHFVVLIDPVGRGRKTKHPVAGDESAAGDGGGGRGRANVGRPGKDGYVAARGTSVAARRREREGRQRESGKAPRGGDGRNRAREWRPTSCRLLQLQPPAGWLHSCLHGDDELYVKSTWTCGSKKDGRIHSFPRIFRVRDFPFFHVDALRVHAPSGKSDALDAPRLSLIMRDNAIPRYLAYRSPYFLPLGPLESDETRRVSVAIDSRCLVVSPPPPTPRRDQFRC